MTDPIAEQSIRELSEELETARKDRQALVEQGVMYKGMAIQRGELLRRIVKYAREDRAATPGVTRLARVLAEAEKLLSGSTPAPAAPCGGMLGGDWLEQEAKARAHAGELPAPVAESEPEPHRMCAQANDLMARDLVHAKTRIAELEARYDAVLKDFIHEGDAAAAFRTLIAQAVAVLEQGLAFRDVEGGAFSPIRAERALELLRGNRT